MAVDSKEKYLYAIGGMNCRANCYGEDVEYLSTIERYSEQTGTWTRLPSMPTPRREPTAVIVRAQTVSDYELFVFVVMLPQIRTLLFILCTSHTK